MALSTDDPSDRLFGVRSGGVSEAELRDAGAIAVYDDVAALLADLDLNPLAMTWKGTVVR